MWFSWQEYGSGLPPPSKGSSHPRDQTCISYIFCIGRQILYTAPPKVIHTINGYYYCHDKFLEKYEFRCNLIHTWLPSVAQFSGAHWILNLEAAWKRRHSLAGESRKPLLRKLGIESTKWVTLHAHTHTYTPSAFSQPNLLRSDGQIESFLELLLPLGKLIRIVPLTFIRNGQVPPSPRIGQLGLFYISYHFQTPRISS